MTLVIYLDVLVALNLYITWFLILGTEYLSERSSTLFRRGLASLLGGLSSLWILVEVPLWGSFLFKVACALILSGIAFGFTSFFRLIRSALWFLFVSFLFGGAVLALILLLEPDTLLLRNGVAYFHLSPIFLVLATAFSYAVARLISLWNIKRRPKEYRKTGILWFQQKKLSLTVSYDSGNRLFSLSGCPVLLCKKEVLARLFQTEESALECQPPPELKRRIELIPSHSVGGERLLTAFRTDGFCWEGEENIGLRRVYAALLPEGELLEDADAIAGDSLFSML